jgi:uncharacterized membrane protein YgcG
MKKVLSLVMLVMALMSCHSTGQNNVVVTSSQSTNNNIQVSAENIPGFNVQVFANLVKTTANPQVLEQQINDPNSGINTLDLDKDGNVDYLKVVERANQLVVIDEIPNNQITIATLNITPNGDVNVNGIPTYCGQNYYYHNHYSLTDAILLSYLLRPHLYYVPRYHYGYYPSYYHRTTVISTRTRIISSPSYRSSYRTANYNRPTTPNRTSLSNPTTSQRSFTPRVSTPVRTGGFGSSSSSRSSFGSSSRSSFGSSSRSSFGGGSRGRR